MTDLAPAVVLSHGPGGLGTVRSLARRGIEVIVIAYDDTDPVLHSRYPVTKEIAIGATDRKKELDILSKLNNLPDQGAVILTTSDRMVTFISSHRETLLKKYRFKLPPASTLDALNDKRKETQLLQSLGFAIPKTIIQLPSSAAELEGQLRFPIIFKPNSVFVQNVFPLKNIVVHDRQALDRFYQEWDKAISILLAQEVITGPDTYSWICSCTFDSQFELLDCAIKQKIRALPAHFGGSTHAVSRRNEEIVELTRIIGKKLKYVGHAGVEFRWDARDQQYKFIELNPRIPANVCFDEACGLPTVWNSYKVSLDGSAVHSRIKQKEGVFYLDLQGDLFSQFADKTSILRMATSYFPFLFRRTNGPYFAWDDPKPGIVLAWQFAVMAIGSIFRKIRNALFASRWDRKQVLDN